MKNFSRIAASKQDSQVASVASVIPLDSKQDPNASLSISHSLENAFMVLVLAMVVVDVVVGIIGMAPLPVGAGAGAGILVVAAGTVADAVPVPDPAPQLKVVAGHEARAGISARSSLISQAK